MPPKISASIQRSSVVERSAVNRLVVGSNPTPGATVCVLGVRPSKPSQKFLISGYSSTTANRAKCATACAAKAYHESRSQTCRSHLSAPAFERNAYSLRIQPEPSRPAGTAAEVAGRVVRFVVRSTTDSYEKDAERSKTGVHKCLSPQEKASSGSRSSARRSYRAGRCARPANPLGRRRL